MLVYSLGYVLEGIPYVLFHSAHVTGTRADDKGGGGSLLARLLGVRTTAVHPEIRTAGLGKIRVPKLLAPRDANEQKTTNIFRSVKSSGHQNRSALDQHAMKRREQSGFRILSWGFRHAFPR
jgi:hypothetical protein